MPPKRKPNSEAAPKASRKRGANESEQPAKLRRTEAGPRPRAVMSCGMLHAVVALEGSRVVCWGMEECEDYWRPVPDFTGSAVTAVCAGASFSGAIVDGVLRTWGKKGEYMKVSTQKLRGKKLVRLAASDVVVAVAAVDDSGTAYICGRDDCDDLEQVPERLAGSVADVVICGTKVVILTRQGAVLTSDANGDPYTEFDLGGARAVSISQGVRGFAVVLEGGAVRWCGEPAFDIPSDVRGVVSCAVGDSEIIALCGDGTVRRLKTSEPVKPPALLSAGNLSAAGPLVAVAAGTIALAVTAGGDLAAAWTPRDAKRKFSKPFCRVPDLGGRKVLFAPSDPL
eukprot:TRINITY_DN19214_c0_g1_i1.p1 TRINITY_DN19214_c0_g1~~TRINITY_DN19214_c0_g1_i1.p1  ORF type:complete len:340 (+),score=88.98 TRINITY_DN19214_c0_g1_i1:67-1086(+)